MKTQWFLITGLAASIAACSGMPAQNSNLDSARAHYQMAESNPQVAMHSEQELEQAAESLDEADRAVKAEKAAPTVEHLIYMADREVTVAETTATLRAAQQTTRISMLERSTDAAALRTGQDAQMQQQLDQKSAQIAALNRQLELNNAQDTNRWVIITLGDVLFDPGRSAILPNSAGNLQKLADVLNEDDVLSVSINGHTDSTGSRSFNDTLSLRRADSVKRELIRLGVSDSQIKTHAMGQDHPIADNETSAGRQMNRRVEVLVNPAFVSLSASR